MATARETGRLLRIDPPQPGAVQAGAAPASRLMPECESWDGGRLQIHLRFVGLLRANNLTSFESLFRFTDGELVRRAGPRETRRIVLSQDVRESGQSPVTFAPPTPALPPRGGEGVAVQLPYAVPRRDTGALPVTLYVKRHSPPPWRDRLMPWLHFSRPIHGARNEWDALWKFIQCGIPTMTPVAFGESAGRSLLVTEALSAPCNLLEWVAARSPSSDRGTLRAMIERVAWIARQMHASGLHHQDFYLNHLLLCGGGDVPDVRVIDLGRVRHRQPLGIRWILKDLSQLDFSARGLSCASRLRFLRLYLGRPFTAQDRRMIRLITTKSRRIAAHTRKHKL